MSIRHAKYILNLIAKLYQNKTQQNVYGIAVNIAVLLSFNKRKCLKNNNQKSTY